MIIAKKRPSGKVLWYNIVMNDISNCMVCRKPLSGKQRSFCCTDCKNQYFLSYKAQKQRAEKRKAELIAEHGGKCEHCGYNFSLSALSFYDRAGGSLHIDANVLANSNFKKLEKELKNAQVLCRNCYEELQTLPLPSRPSKVSGEIPQEILPKGFLGSVRSLGMTDACERLLRRHRARPFLPLVGAVQGLALFLLHNDKTVVTN